MPSPLYTKLFPEVRGAHRTDRDDRRDEFAPAFGASDATPSSARRQKTPGLQKPTLISSYHGRIEELLFMLPADVFRWGDEPTYQSVLQALPVGTRFVVATHSSVLQQAMMLFDGAGHGALTEFIELPENLSFTDWTEDAFLGARDVDGSRHLLEPFYFWRQADSLVADYLEDVIEVRASPTPLIFQGGNCLVGDTFWLLGEDYFSDTLDLLQGERPPVSLPSTEPISDSAVLGLFRQFVEAERELIRVSSAALPLPPSDARYAVREQDQYFLDYAYRGIGRAQPIFHIDMFITLVGRPVPEAPFKVLVGSPQLAADLTDDALGPYALQPAFDSVASQLQAQGFEVFRNPLPVVSRTGKVMTLAELAQSGLEARVVSDFLALGATPTTQVTARDWYHASANNCLVQTSGIAGNHVYLPTFGSAQYPKLQRVDEWMQQWWCAQGFTAHLLGDFHAFARRMGVVHCIKKYLARGD